MAGWLQLKFPRLSVLLIANILLSSAAFLAPARPDPWKAHRSCWVAKNSCRWSSPIRPKKQSRRWQLRLLWQSWHTPWHISSSKPMIQNAIFSLCQTVQPGSWQLRQSGHHAEIELFRPVTLRPCLSTGLPFLCVPQIIKFWLFPFNSKYILDNREIQ